MEVATGSLLLVAPSYLLLSTPPCSLGWGGSLHACSDVMSSGVPGSLLDGGGLLLCTHSEEGLSPALLGLSFPIH